MLGIISDIKVSVIVPVYNSEKTVLNCIESIQNQTHKYLEIIIVNDGSLDKSGDICDALAASDKRIKVFHQENQGVSQARNLGIENATAEYLCFVDSDDIVKENMVSVLLSIMVENQSQMSIAGFDMCYEDSEKQLYEKSKVWHLNELDFDGFSTLSEKWIMSPMTSKMFLTRIIKENKIKLEKGLICGEDHLFVFDYLKYCNRIVFCEDCLYRYNCFNSPGGRFFPLDGQIKIFESKNAFVKTHCKNEGEVGKRFEAAYALHNLKVRVLYHIKRNFTDIEELKKAYETYWKYVIPYLKNKEYFLCDDWVWYVENKKDLLNGNMKEVYIKTFKRTKREKRNKKIRSNIKELLKMPPKELVVWLLKKLK